MILYSAQTKLPKKDFYYNQAVEAVQNINCKIDGNGSNRWAMSAEEGMKEIYLEADIEKYALYVQKHDVYIFDDDEPENRAILENAILEFIEQNFDDSEGTSLVYDIGEMMEALSYLRFETILYIITLIAEYHGFNFIYSYDQENSFDFYFSKKE